jgi:hypothetical protein
MQKYTFTTYSPILKKTFTQVEWFSSMANFRLYAMALYSAGWELLSVE